MAEERNMRPLARAGDGTAHQLTKLVSQVFDCGQAIVEFSCCCGHDYTMTVGACDKGREHGPGSGAPADAFHRQLFLLGDALPYPDARGLTGQRPWAAN